MAKVLVLYDSTYGHMETMAQEVARGAAEVPDTRVDLRRVPETMDPGEHVARIASKLFG